MDVSEPLLWGLMAWHLIADCYSGYRNLGHVILLDGSSLDGSSQLRIFATAFTSAFTPRFRKIPRPRYPSFPRLEALPPATYTIIFS